MNGTLELTLPAPKLPRHPFKATSARDDFDDDKLALQWNFLRNPYKDDFSLTARPGYLRLNGSDVTLNDQDSPAFVGRRQTDFNCTASTLLEFDPKNENEEAGLVARGFDKFHYEIGITLRQGKRQVFLRRVLKGQTIGLVEYADVQPGPVTLSVKASELSYEFSYKTSTSDSKVLGKAPMKDLSMERISSAGAFCFTGVYFGMYATGNGKKSTTPADFDWFDFTVYKK